MTVQEKKAHAYMAVRWVQQNMPRGAGNIAQMVAQGDEDDVVNRVTASRAVMSQIAAMLTNEGAQINAKLTVLQAALSQKLQVGNCDEQASAAFLYLRRKGINGLQLLTMSMQPYRNDVHVFVALADADLDETNFQAWNNQVVICDPWMAEMAAKANDQDFITGVYSPQEWGEYLEGAGVSDPYRHNVVRRAVAV